MDFITGAHNLKELYGYWHNLGDACLLGIEMKGDSIRLRISIYDLPAWEPNRKNELYCEVGFTCSGVMAAQIYSWQGDIGNSCFSQTDEYVTMQWFDQSNFEASTIRCSALSVEVLKVGREFKQKSINDLDLVLFV